MAVLVFITVLIVLLLILTVMVHMRNRKLKSTLEEQMAERRLLDKICADFTAVYYVELNTGSFEILHINDGTNSFPGRSALHTIIEVNRIRTSMNFLRHRQSKYTRMRNIFSHWWVFGILMISWKKKLRSRIN